MEERQVSVDGATYALPEPFFVVATQNPHEQLGTFALPESQLDRFLMRVTLGYPDAAHERALLRGGERRELLAAIAAGADRRRRACGVQQRGAQRARLGRAARLRAGADRAARRERARPEARPVAARRPGSDARRAGLGAARRAATRCCPRTCRRCCPRSSRTASSGATRPAADAAEHRARADPRGARAALTRERLRHGRRLRAGIPSSTCARTAGARGALGAPPPGRGRAAGHAAAPAPLHPADARRASAFAALVFVMLLAGLNYANSLALFLTFLLAGFALVVDAAVPPQPARRTACSRRERAGGVRRRAPAALHWRWATRPPARRAGARGRPR